MAKNKPSKLSESFLRHGDKLLSYYLVAGGHTLWIVERNGDIVIQSIVSAASYYISHITKMDDSNIEAIRRTLDVFGFTTQHERYVNANFSNIPPSNKQELQSQFDIFDQESERRLKEQIRLAEEKKKEQDEKPVEKKQELEVLK